MPTFSGIAAPFNSESVNLGGFVEVLRPGAFRRALREQDVFALHHHDTGQVLGRTSSGTLTLSETSEGLRFKLDAPDTSTGRDLVELIGRKDVRSCSFAFMPRGSAGERWSERSDGLLLRELLDVDLLEITVTAMPAYPASSVKVNSAAAGRSAPDLQAVGGKQSARMTRVNAKKRHLEAVAR